MTQAIAKYAAKKMLSGEMDKYKSKNASGPYDPYYQQIPIPRKPGKFKKVKKQIPAYIPSHDANILARARKNAYRLDFSLFNLFGLRFGWSAIIGLIPIFGDFADAIMAFLLISYMGKVTDGLPSSVKGRMMFNLCIDLGIGLIPFVGDLADAYVKCNGKNVRLLEQHLDAKYKPRELIAAEEKMNADSRPDPATVFEDFSDEETDRRGTLRDQEYGVQQPQRAHSGRRNREPDVEMGMRGGHDTRREDKLNRKGTKSSRR